MNHEEQKETHDMEQDPFTRFLFGERRNNHFQQHGVKDRNQSPSNDENQLNELLSNVNVEDLMKNIDTIMSSASQFKPLLNKLGPLINKWIK